MSMEIQLLYHANDIVTDLYSYTTGTYSAAAVLTRRRVGDCA